MPKGPKGGMTGDQGLHASPNATPPADWKIFKHPTGLSLHYPPDWQFSVQNAAAMLTPPDQASNAQGPSEVYLLLSESANGITSVEDPRVIPYLEAQLAQLAPFLRRGGQPESVSTANRPGIALHWSGQNPFGLAVRAFMQATILKGYVLALGDQAKINARETTVRAIFASLDAGEGQHDPVLVGAWKFWSYHGSADGRYGSETSRQFRLQADGFCFWSSSSESSGSFAGRDSFGNTTWTGGLAGQNSSGIRRGRWTGGGGELNVVWDDGSTAYWKYQVNPPTGTNRRLFLQGNQAKPDEWVEA